MKKFFPFSFLLVSLIAVSNVKAHCPLCVIGAGAAAAGASYLGVNQAVIGIFIGAFAVSMGWWVSNLLKKEYIKYQKAILIVFSFVSTIFPMLMIMQEFRPLYVTLGGGYGSIFNRVYLINLFVIGSFLGGIVMIFSPYLSSKITEYRKGKHIPYQGMIITFALLIIIGIIVQIMMR